MKDRTEEFFSILRSASSISPQPNPRSRVSNSRSMFAQKASALSKQIESTTHKLETLTKLAKKSTLFDESAREMNIAKLTSDIKEELSVLNHEIASLQSFVATNPNGSQQHKHSSTIVVTLQTQLASTSMAFKDCLESQNQSMQELRNRREQYSFAEPSLIEHSSSVYRGHGGTDYMAIGGFGETQQLVMENNESAYLNERSTAVEAIESTIAELGTIFQQLAHMVSEQRELVQRIDSNVDDIEANVSGAQSQLLKYYASISSNRWLMIKVFAVIVVFFLLFVLIL